MPKYEVNNSEKQNRFVKFFKNGDGTFFGRSPMDWGLLFLYFVIFYSVLGSFFCGQLYIFINYMIKTDIPYRTGRDSILELKPGVSVWPKSFYSSVYSSTNNESNLYQKYVNSSTDALNELFKNATSLQTECDFEKNLKLINDIQVPCKFDRDLLGKCSDPKKEMDEGNVCIYWKINRIFGYIPDIANTSFADTILLNCTGQNPADVENLRQPVYYPSIRAGDGKEYGKFSHAFFPFLNQPGFQNQLVAVQFPNMTKNVAVLVKCSLINLKEEMSIGKLDLFVSTVSS